VTAIQGEILEIRSLSLFEGEGQGEGALEPGVHVSAGISDLIQLGKPFDMRYAD